MQANEFEALMNHINELDNKRSRIFPLEVIDVLITIVKELNEICIKQDERIKTVESFLTHSHDYRALAHLLRMSE
jgi:hypothetical protein